MCNTLATLLRKSKAHVDIERAVPQLYKVDRDSGHVTEAILDVVSNHPGGLSLTMVDVTVRSPHADRYAHTDRVPGVAATGGETDKADRYGPTVMPLSCEPYGRLGVASAHRLRALAWNASRFGDHSTPPARLYSRWRAELERCLVFEVTDTFLLALGHSGGVRAVRRHRTGRDALRRGAG